MNLMINPKRNKKTDIVFIFKKQKNAKMKTKSKQRRDSQSPEAVKLNVSMRLKATF